ncbi:MAG: OmpH family outer membrane protein [Crocinitomicaceae bacterium]|nr:OmpH family outer membrane protein [Crocinitomicaceae bacterium]MDP4683833.1 OmpH family outer membrane protein [Crocinitomicaceae bacterium]MDP4865696.1 OmpH family outer membrane protein [Crocinitomicaceae bacterium]
MKIVNSLMITAVAVGLLTSCGKSEKAKENTTPKVEARSMGELKIAYYDSDSLKKYFVYYKEQDSLVTKKQLTFQKEVERRRKDFEGFIVRNEQKAQSGLLSQNEMMQIQQKMQQMEQDLMRYQQEQGSKLEEETMKKLDEISKKIIVLGEKFSKENKIDVFFMHGNGGQINYINPSMNVTKEFVAYLNQNQADIEKDLK